MRLIKLFVAVSVLGLALAACGGQKAAGNEAQPAPAATEAAPAPAPEGGAAPADAPAAEPAPAEAGGAG